MNIPKLSVLSDACGYSESYVSRILKGKRDCKLSCAITLARAMDCSLDEFVTFINKDNVEPSATITKYPTLLAMRLAPSEYV